MIWRHYQSKSRRNIHRKRFSLDGCAQLLGLGDTLGGHAEGLGHHHEVWVDVRRQPRLLVVTILHTQPPGSQSADAHQMSSWHAGLLISKKSAPLLATQKGYCPTPAAEIYSISLRYLSAVRNALSVLEC